MLVHPATTLCHSSRKTLRTVLAEQALRQAEGEQVEEEEEEDEAAARGRKGESRRLDQLAYDEEQRRLREEFLRGVHGDDSEDEGLLQVKMGREAALGQGREAAGHESQVNALLEGLFGPDDQLDENNRFLKTYILNKGWVDGKEEGEDEEEDEEVDAEDEEAVEAAEQFEMRYNFRFEDPEGAQLITYPRKVEGTVRKEESSRKRQRDAKKEREEQKSEQLAQEVKRLKTLKRKEIADKAEEVLGIAGPGLEQSLLDELLEGDFDPEEYDRKLAAAFGDQYYQADDGKALLWG